MRNTSQCKRVIINADDFGFSEGVTEGILRAHMDGVVTSTTITANMPAAQDAADRLAGAPRLGVGVHLNVTQGPPLSRKGRSLAGPRGVMDRKAPQLFRAMLFRPWLLDAIEVECDAQIRWAIARGIAPTHLDSHRHVHGYWPIFGRVARLARRYHIPFVRWYAATPAFCGRGPGRSQRSVGRMLNLFGGGMVVLSPGLRGTRGTLGIASTGRIDVSWLIDAALNMPAGVWEIMTHPGRPDGLDASHTRLIESRRMEMDALCSPSVAQAFERNGIELIHYGQIGRNS